MRHRVLSNDEDVKPMGEAAEDDKYLPRAPDIGMDDDDVENTEFEYSDRAPTDYVVSGPLGPDGWGPGQRFNSVAAALIWLTRRVGGNRIKRRIVEAEAGNRWAFLVAQGVQG